MSDKGRIAEIAAEAYASSAFGGIEIDPPTFFEFLDNAIMGRSAGAWVAEKDGTVEGAMVAILSPLFFSKKLAAMNHMVLVSRKGAGAGIGLIRQFIKWAKSNPQVGSILLSATSGMPQQQRVEKLFSRLGTYAGSVYTVEV